LERDDRRHLRSRIVALRVREYAFPPPERDRAGTEQRAHVRRRPFAAGKLDDYDGGRVIHLNPPLL
jgi:hypothetical protein